MPNNRSHPSAISGFMRKFSLNFPHPFAKTNTYSAQSEYPRLETSDFSRPDLSELYALEEEICPLVEAEIYLIYGRHDDCEATLEAGLRNGRITSAQIAIFWSNQGKASDQMSAD